MKKDMHYYGTYCMARAAGIEPASAQIIATASQYVDEAATKMEVELEDGSKVLSRATGHHMADIKNLSRDDQRQVWVPFHFLPGCVGDSFSEKLICRMDSKPARQMVEHHLDHADADFGRELIGVTAHVYADTFAHYGFSGVSSRWNKSDNETIEVETDDPDLNSKLMDGLGSFLGKFGVDLPNYRRKVMTEFAEGASGALGHGSVGTYPDMPYLWWCFDYEISGKTSGRKNDKTFLAACKALHSMFQEFVKRAPQYADGRGGRNFSEIESSVIEVLEFVGETNERIEKWRTDAEQGKFYDAFEGKITTHREEGWTADLKGFENSTDSQSFVSSSSYRFFQAASLHRNYVLRDLMPQHGIVIV